VVIIFRKLLSFMLCCVLLFSAYSSSVSAKSLNTDIDSTGHTIIIGNDEFSNRVLSSVESMAPYITVGPDNTYQIDPKAKEIVDKDIYAF
jgi:hypothetical protein